MTTVEHIIITYLGLMESSDNPEKEFYEEIPYTLLPDSLRYYLGKRQPTHFEKTDAGDSSWYEFPSKLKDLDKEKALEQSMYISENIKEAALGEYIDIEKYKEKNNLPIIIHENILKHFEEDTCHDKFIRSIIDTKDKDKDIYYFEGKEYSGKEIRKIIADISTYGQYVLAAYAWFNYNITINQEWYDKYAKKAIYDAYPQDMAENTCKYFTIREDINEYITNHDFSHINEGPIKDQKHYEMFEYCINELVEIERESRKKINTNRLMEMDENFQGPPYYSLEPEDFRKMTIGK